MKRHAKNIILLVIITFVMQHNCVAQDPHFSQYFSSPLTFNPAFTGYFDGLHRATANFRTQWSALGEPYTTATASFDTKILKNRIGSNDRWGVGVHALYDEAAGGIYRNSYVSFSTAFNKGLDENGDQSLGIGIQATMANDVVDFNKISFSTQFSGNGFDLSIPSGETVNNRAVTYMDLNAGVLYNYRTESGNQFSFGASLFHILKPKLYFFTGNNNAVAPRMTVHSGASFNVGEKDQLFLSAHVMKQRGADEQVLGGAYGFGIGETETTFYAGAWIRFSDAVYPYVGLRGNNYQLGLTYDINNSDLSRIQRFGGSAEVSFIFFFSNERRKGIPCFF